jgi:hypothetical protein
MIIKLINLIILLHLIIMIIEEVIEALINNHLKSIVRDKEIINKYMLI